MRRRGRKDAAKPEGSLSMCCSNLPNNAVSLKSTCRQKSQAYGSRELADLIGVSGGGG